MTTKLNEDTALLISSLQFDRDHYQRAPAGKAWVRHLVSNWDDKKAWPILVSARDDGSYWVIDGQGRCMAAAALRGDAAVAIAVIRRNLTIQQEADLFVDINRLRRPVSVNAAFHARLTRGDPDAIAITSILHSLGIAMRLTSNNPHGTNAIATLQAVWQRGRTKHLMEVLGLLQDAFKDNPRAFQSPGIGGLSQFLLRYPEADRNRMVDVLERRGPNGMYGLALQMRGTFATGALDTVWGRALREEYNKGLRTHKLGEWVERVFDTIPQREAAARSRGVPAPRSPRKPVQEDAAS